MMNKYAIGSLGVLLGALVTVPLFSYAARGSSSSTGYHPSNAPLSQACVEAMAAVDDATLAHIDADTQAHKDALTARSAALKAAAAIKDSAQRIEAVKQAKEDYVQTLHVVEADDLKAAVEAQFAACNTLKKGASHSRSSKSHTGASSSSRGEKRTH